MLLPFQGDIASLLDTQGDALGWQLLAFQAVLYLSIFMAKVCGFAFFSYLCKQIEGILDS